jgi:outer membrane protein assembly factor BamE (lipoprotein component of BamABCDE complex)
MKRILTRISVLTFAVLVVTSCITNGREFPSKFDWIKKSKTRMDDVRLMLGDPQFVGSSDGTPSWTYGYYNYKAFGPSHTKELKIYWNQDRTVQSWSFNSSFPTDVQSASSKQQGRPASDVSR